MKRPPRPQSGSQAAASAGRQNADQNAGRGVAGSYEQKSRATGWRNTGRKTGVPAGQTSALKKTIGGKKVGTPGNVGGRGAKRGSRGRGGPWIPGDTADTTKTGAATEQGAGAPQRKSAFRRKTAASRLQLTGAASSGKTTATPPAKSAFTRRSASGATKTGEEKQNAPRRKTASAKGEMSKAVFRRRGSEPPTKTGAVPVTTGSLPAVTGGIPTISGSIPTITGGQRTVATGKVRKNATAAAPRRPRKSRFRRKPTAHPNGSVRKWWQLGRPESRSVNWMFLGGMVGLIMVLVGPPILDLFDQIGQARELSAQVKVAKEKNRQLRRELSKWQNPDYMAAQARERLGYVNKGQTQYIVVDPDPKYQRQPAIRSQMTVPQPWFMILEETTETAGKARAAKAGNKHGTPREGATETPGENAGEKTGGN